MNKLIGESLTDRLSVNKIEARDFKIEYEEVESTKILFENSINPFSKLKKSSEFFSSSVMKNKLEVIKKIGQLEPFVVYEDETGQLLYIGPLELKYALDDYCASKKVAIDTLQLWVVKVKGQLSDDLIAEYYMLLNPDSNIPDHLFRLLRMRHLLNRKIAKSSIREIYKVSSPSSAEAKRYERDIKICESDIMFELVVGIKAELAENTLPVKKKALLSYTHAIKIINILPLCPKNYSKFKIDLELWVLEAQRYEIEADRAKPFYERTWYSRNKVEDIAYAISSVGPLVKIYHDVKEKIWGVRCQDSNKRLLVVPELKIDIRKKTEKDIQLFFDASYKARKLSYTLDSHIKTIAPIKHGHAIRGRATEDDSTFEIRSNLPEFYNLEYFSHVFHSRMLLYCNSHGLLQSIGLESKDFGFLASEENISLTFSKIKKTFLRKYKILLNRGYAIEVVSWVEVEIFSREFILQELEAIIQNFSSEDDSIDLNFKKFFLFTFTKLFENIDKEIEIRKNEAKKVSRPEDIHKSGARGLRIVTEDEIILSESDL